MIIDFTTGGNSEQHAISGWHRPELHGTWTSGTASRLRLPPARSPDGYRATLHLSPYVSPGHVAHQELILSVAGVEVFREAIAKGGAFRFAIPTLLMGTGGYFDLDIHCPTAASPLATGGGHDVRVLGVLVGTLSLDDAAAAVAGPAPAAPAKPFVRPRIAAVTMCFNEPEYLPLWIKHYAKQVGIENCYVIDHGSTDGSTDNLGKCNVLRIPRSPYEPHKQSEFNSGFCSSLLTWYDWVVYADTDEFLMADPKVASTLTEFCARPLPDVVSAIGLNVIHRPDLEPELDLARPVTEQRRYVFGCSPMCKPTLIRRPVVWSPGSHSADAPTSFDHLYMFHLRWFDLPYGLRRLKRTREMAWARTDAGAHARVQDDQMAHNFRSFARLPPIADCDFDPQAAPIAPFLDRVRASREGREDQTYKISLDIWMNELWRIPDRFVGAF